MELDKRTEKSPEDNKAADYIYPFYRCESCKSLLTSDDEAQAKITGNVCECGGRRYRPSWPTREEKVSDKVTAFMLRHDHQWPDGEAPIQ